jgi:pilus assembly protein Flp/PilA
LEETLVLTNLKSVLVDEDGATLVEYALVVSLIAIACIATVTALGGQINTAFTKMQTTLAAA